MNDEFAKLLGARALFAYFITLLVTKSVKFLGKREVPLLFKPGQFYALTALVGCICFVILAIAGRMEVEKAAFLAIGLTFLLRLLTIRFDWQSRAV